MSKLRASYRAKDWREYPWHPDFPAPDETLEGQRLNLLAYNLTLVEICEDMGLFEIASGTQWDYSPAFEHDMFPPKSFYGTYEERAQQKMPEKGDISARSVLAIHRGTANQSKKVTPCARVWS